MPKPLIKSVAKTFVTDKGWDNAMKQIGKARAGSFVKVGIQSTQAQEDRGGITLAEIGAVLEFGTRKAGKNKDVTIPARSHIRSTMDEQRKVLQVMTDRLIVQVMLGQFSMKRMLGILGEFIEAKIKRKITVLRDPENAPSTIAKKGSSNPLIDSGRYRASIRHKIVVKNKPLKRKVPVNGELNVGGGS